MPYVQCVEDNKVRDWQKIFKLRETALSFEFDLNYCRRRMRNDATDRRPQAHRDLDFGINPSFYERPETAVTVNPDESNYCIRTEDLNDWLEDDLSLEILACLTDNPEPSNGSTIAHADPPYPHASSSSETHANPGSQIFFIL